MALKTNAPFSRAGLVPARYFRCVMNLQVLLEKGVSELVQCAVCDCTELAKIETIF
jgi:hypothetical protein